MEGVYLFPAFNPNEKFLAFVSSVALLVPSTALVVDVDHKVFWAVPSRISGASHIHLLPTHTNCAEGLLALPQHLDTQPPRHQGRDRRSWRVRHRFSHSLFLNVAFSLRAHWPEQVSVGPLSARDLDMQSSTWICMEQWSIPFSKGSEGCGIVHALSSVSKATWEGGGVDPPGWGWHVFSYVSDCEVQGLPGLSQLLLWSGETCEHGGSLQKSHI